MLRIYQLKALRSQNEATTTSKNSLLYVKCVFLCFPTSNIWCCFFGVKSFLSITLSITAYDMYHFSLLTKT